MLKREHILNVRKHGRSKDVDANDALVSCAHENT